MMYSIGQLLTERSASMANDPKRYTLTRRQMLSLMGVVGASALFPSTSFAEESSYESADNPPNPVGMLTNEEAFTATNARSAGPSWNDSASGDGNKAFYNGDGSIYLDPAYKVIDVSEHNGTIDWNSVKAAGVDAAIIRLGFGCDRADYQLRNNINGCASLGIPYGLYLYSYAYDANFAGDEANFTANLIEEYGCKPTLPIFYDLEKWTWTGHTPPSTPSAYRSIVNRYCSVMKSRGYGNVRVYSYRSYLNNELRHDDIWSRAAWGAEYGSSTISFDNPYYEGCLAWQYTSTGSISGISGNVDVNAFPPFYKLAFGDVNTKTDHYQDIWWLAENSISEGFPDGTYRGLNSVARQDMAAFLHRIKQIMG